MDINTLRLLTQVSKLGSFAATARAFDLDPSYISRAVKQAEEDLGVRLFQRSTRILRVTDAGRLFLSSIERIVDGYDQTLEQTRGMVDTPVGTVRLTASVAFTQSQLIPLLGQFQQHFSNVTLELIADDKNLDLIKENIDIAIRLAPSITDDVICAKLFGTTYRVYASPDYLKRNPALSQPQQLAQASVVRIDLPAHRNRWRFRDQTGGLRQIAVNGNLVFSNVLSMKDAVVLGHGPGMIADWLAAEDVKAGNLVDLFPGVTFTATTFDTAAWIVYANRGHLPAKTRKTIDFLKTYVGRPL